MRTSHGILCVASAIVLAACSGGTTAVPTVQQAAAAGDPQRDSATQARVTLVWSASSHSESHARSPRFISPSAQSVQIEVAPADKLTKAATTTVNRPKGTNRSTVTFAVPAGSDEFFFTVFDKRNATGNGIGGAQVIKTMRAGATTTVGVTLDGYVASAALTPGTGKEFLKTNLAVGGAAGYTIVGSEPITMTAAFMDADGNVILPSQSGASIAVSINQPSLISLRQLSSNSFVIRAIAPNPAFTPISIDLHVSSGASGIQQFSQQFALHEEALLYAAASGSPGSVTLFDQEGKTYKTPGGFPGLQKPIATVWDSFDGILFVADAMRNAVLAYDANGSALSGWSNPAVPGITSVAYNHDTHKVYAAAAQTAGAPHDAILAFDLHGNSVKAGEFPNVVGPTSIAYENWARMNNPTGNDQFWLITTYSTGTAILRTYSTNGGPANMIVEGQPVPSETLTGSGFIPSALSAYPPSFVTFGSGEVGGTGGDGPLIAGTYNGAGALDIGQVPSTGAGLSGPRVAVQDPLFGYDAGVGIANQPVEFYVANDTGGLDAIGNTTQGAFEKVTSVSFPPPSGATSFSALDVTF
jgi:hypothetical protein